jgi:hypothetical protein
VFVRKLRSKLEVVSPGWRYVHTHFGVGYRFAPEPLDQGPADGEAGATERAASRREPPEATNGGSRASGDRLAAVR